MAEDEANLMPDTSKEKDALLPEYKDYAGCEDIPMDSKEELLLSQYHENQLKGPFPFKLHIVLKILNQEGSHHIISWSPHGRSFQIKSQHRFEVEVIPRFFKTNQMSSFRRQLNLYEFVRINDGLEAGCYYHELFLRSKPLLSLKMERINRKGTITRPRQDSPPFSNFPVMPPLHHRVSLSMSHVPPKVTIGMTIRGPLPPPISVVNRNQMVMEPNFAFNTSMGGAGMLYGQNLNNNNVIPHNMSMGHPYMNMDQLIHLNVMNGRGAYNTSDFDRERNNLMTADFATNMSHNGPTIGSFMHRGMNMMMDQDEILDRYSMNSGSMSDRSIRMGNRIGMGGENMTFGSGNVHVSNMTDPINSMNRFSSSFDNNFGSMMSDANPVINMSNHMNSNLLYSRSDDISNLYAQQQLFLQQNQSEYLARMNASNGNNFSNMMSQNGMNGQNVMSMNNLNNSSNDARNMGNNPDDYSMMERLSAHLRRRGRNSLSQSIFDNNYENHSHQSSHKRKTKDIESTSRKSGKSDGIHELTMAAFRMANISVPSDVGSSQWTYNAVSEDANLTRTFMSVQSEGGSEKASTWQTPSRIPVTSHIDSHRDKIQDTRSYDTYHHGHYGV